jgi:hypothetical protein
MAVPNSGSEHELNENIKNRSVKTGNARNKFGHCIVIVFKAIS